MGPRNDHWITEGNRRESEKPTQVLDGKGGFIPSVGSPGSRKGCVPRRRMRLDSEGISKVFRSYARHRFYGSIGNIWLMWNQLVATVYRRAESSLQRF